MDEQVLRLLIKAEVDQAVRSLDTLKEKAGATESAALKLGQALKSAVDFAAVVSVVKKGVEAYVDAEQALVKLNAVYKATNGAVGLTTDELVAFSSELEATTGVADDAALQMESLLLTFKNIQGDAFKETARLAVDLAAVMGGDLNGAAMQLGKAMEDPANGVAMLNRQLRLFSEAEVEVLKNLTETGRAAEAQTMILTALEGKVGGTAAAMQDTLGGALRDAGNALDNLLEVLGEGFAPTVAGIANGVEGFAKAMQMVPAPVLATATAAGAAALAVPALATALSALGVTINTAVLGPVGLVATGLVAIGVALANVMADIEKRQQAATAGARNNTATLAQLNEEYQAAQANLTNLRARFDEVKDQFTANSTVGRIWARDLQTAEERVLSLGNRLYGLGRVTGESASQTQRLAEAQAEAARQAAALATAERQAAALATAERQAAALAEWRSELERLYGTYKNQEETLRNNIRLMQADLALAQSMRGEKDNSAESNRRLDETIQGLNEKLAAERVALANLLNPFQATSDAASELSRDMEDVVNSMQGGRDQVPFQSMIDGANAFKDALSFWGPAIQGVQNILGELDSQWKAENAARIAGLQREMEMESLRYSNLIADAEAAGQETIALKQQQADAELRAAAKLDEEKAKIAKAEFERDKAAKLVGIAMATAQGVANALSLGVAGIPLAGVVGALGAAQAAIVAGSKYPGLANGGTVTGSGTVMVGERGPELLNLPRAATVTPLGQGGGITIVVKDNLFAGPGGVDDLVKIIYDRTGQLQRTGVLR